MTTEIVEIRLNKLTVRENGELDGKEGRNLLTVTLIYPRSGQPHLTTAKTMRLRDKDELDFAAGNDRFTGKPFRFEDKLLFKEDVQKSAMLRVQLAVVDKTPGIEKVLAKVFKGIFTGAWSLLTGGIANAALAGGVDALSTFHLNSFEVEDQRVHVIGEAEQLVDLSALANDGSTTTWSLPLVVPADVFRAAPKPKLKEPSSGINKLKEERQLVVAKGSQNGVIDIDLEIL